MSSQIKKTLNEQFEELISQKLDISSFDQRKVIAFKNSIVAANKRLTRETLAAVRSYYPVSTFGGSK